MINGNGSWLARHILALLALALTLSGGIITGMLAQARTESSLETRVQYIQAEQAKRVTRDEFTAVMKGVYDRQELALKDLDEVKKDLKELIRAKVN